MSKFGVFETTHTVAGLVSFLLYRAKRTKTAMGFLLLYYYFVKQVKKKLLKGGIIRTKATGPYEGVVVLDLSMVLAGPIAGQLFSEMGAQVINIESTKQPDAGRLFGRGASRGLSGMYANSGRGKQSVVLDLKHPDGLQAFYDMVKKADVVIQNFRPNAVERLKVDYETCQRINPNIIYCSSTGFGTSGPYMNMRVYDPIIQTVAGGAYVQGGGSGKPQLIGQAFVDKMTAMTSAQAIGAALVVRSKGGGGQHIETNMLKVALQYLWPEVYQGHTFLGQQNMMDAEPADYKHLYAPPDQVQFNPVENAMEDSKFVHEKATHLLFGECRVGTFPSSFSETPTKSRECAVLVRVLFVVCCLLFVVSCLLCVVCCFLSFFS